MRKFSLALVIAVLTASSLLSAQTPTAVPAERMKWPSAYVHPDMPVYGAGEFKGWNRWAANDDYGIFMLIDKTGQADLDSYAAKLKAAGFEQKGSKEFRKGIFRLAFQFNSKTILQISSYRDKVEAWPSALISGVPELKRGYLTGIILPSEDMPGYLQLYFIGLSQGELDAWFAQLAAAGFKVQDGSATKPGMALQGKKWKLLSIQAGENGPGEWMLDFSYADE
ncbi:MAG TPA: hypothetical protein VFL04_06595 [Rectinemataceae bacterium]|nr:hypothetical protein [Rectinemataceae bacterium]